MCAFRTQSAANSLAAAKEETRMRVRKTLETNHRVSLKELDLRKFLGDLKVPAPVIQTGGLNSAAHCALPTTMLWSSRVCIRPRPKVCAPALFLECELLQGGRPTS